VAVCVVRFDCAFWQILWGFVAEDALGGSEIWCALPDGWVSWCPRRGLLAALLGNYHEGQIWYYLVRDCREAVGFVTLETFALCTDGCLLACACLPAWSSEQQQRHAAMDAGAVTCRVNSIPPLLCRLQLCITPGVAVSLSARLARALAEGESSRRLASGMGVAYVTGYIRLLAVSCMHCGPDY